MAYLRSASLLLFCCLVSACGSASGLMRAGGTCNDTWDTLDYRANYEENRTRNTPLTATPPAIPHTAPSEPSSNTNFGACQEDDLINRSCK
jgi:hypothetical protein